MEPPRILFVAPRLDIGGTELHLARILPRLRAAGLNAVLFAIEGGGELESDIIASGVPVRAPRPTVAAGRVFHAALALRREMRAWQPDIVHSFLTEPYLVGSVAAFGLDQPIKIMSRRSLATYQGKYPVFACLERRLHRSAAALLGNSNAVAAQLLAESGAPEKVAVIHNGVEVPPLPDAPMRAKTRRALRVDDASFVIAVVANLFAYKGHADLLAALGAIRARITAPWRLLLIGRDEGVQKLLQVQAEFLGIADNILWLGERRDVHELLAASDLGILPSHEEGFSNALIEMMACGLPVIATRVGGNIDAIADGESGRLVPPRDPAALGEAVLALYASAKTRAAFGRAARKRVEQSFSIEACARRYVALYRGLLQSRGVAVAELIEAGSETPTTPYPMQLSDAL